MTNPQNMQSHRIRTKVSNKQFKQTAPIATATIATVGKLSKNTRVAPTSKTYKKVEHHCQNVQAAHRLCSASLQFCTRRDYSEHVSHSDKTYVTATITDTTGLLGARHSDKTMTLRVQDLHSQTSDSHVPEIARPLTALCQDTCDQAY